METLEIWKWSLVAAGAVILVVAVLLVAILRTARSIDQHALEIWNTGKNIAANTVSIWMLDRTNEIARDMLTTAQSIDASLKSLTRSA